MASNKDISAFRRDFNGEIITPEDSDYDNAHSVWNAMFDRHPALIARCHDADAIAFGRDQGLPHLPKLPPFMRGQPVPGAVQPPLLG